ncbi:MAG: hypothetical protein QF437_03060 [Planctomycetota bacterium]|jgi:hypothetical protein|nr:hypothetical protein [Planctomycetota bacterium]
MNDFSYKRCAILEPENLPAEGRRFDHHTQIREHARQDERFGYQLLEFQLRIQFGVDIKVIVQKVGDAADGPNMTGKEIPDGRKMPGRVSANHRCKVVVGRHEFHCPIEQG